VILRSTFSYPQVLDSSEKKRGSQPKQQQAVQSFEGTQQAPLVGEIQRGVTKRRECVQ
jgi:hypothetical protein